MKTFKKILYIVIMTVSLIYFGTFTAIAQQSENDDPGRERLSGQAAEDFYSGNNSASKAVSLLSLAGANPYTGSSYTHNSMFNNDNVLYGIDVSKYQGSIDWTDVKADGVDFAFIRAGYRGYGTEGTLVQDSYFTQNIVNAAAAGVKTGAYIFSQATTVAEAEEEAEYLVNLVSDYSITMPVVMDFEYAAVNGAAGGRLYDADLSVSQAVKICQAFCAKVKSLGYTPMIYANKTMLENHLDASTLSADYKIWLANYTTKTEYEGNYEFWQYSSTGKVDGISGNVDCNFWYVSDTDTENADISSETGTEDAAGQDETLSSEEPDIEPSITSQKVTGLIKEASTASALTISWNELTDINGYQVYRADSLSGTYKKIKTITDSTVIQLKQTGLTAAREYYYKVRAYQTVNGTNYYSSFSSKLTVYTNAAFTRKAVTKAAIKMKKTAAASASNVVSVAKGVTLSVICFTYDTSGNIWYHVKYTKNSQTYSGYVKGTNLTIYKYGKTTSSLNIRKNAGTSYKVVTNVAKSVKLTILSTKKASNGVVWYRVKYTKNKITYSGYVHSSYVKLV